MLGMIPYVGWIFSLMIAMIGLLIFLIGFILWIILMYNAYLGEKYKLPIIGDIAEKHA